MKNCGLELLRGIAAFFIVGCHLQLLDYTPGANALTHFCDMNVGIFAALAGYLMADGVDSLCGWKEITSYIAKRFRRLLPTYAVWSVVFLIVTAVFQYFMNGAVGSKYGELKFWITVMVIGNASTHLWFIASLFYAQSLMCGALSRLSRAVWLLASAMLIGVSACWQSWYATYPIRLMSFLLLGYCLRPCELKSRNILLAALAVLALAIHAVADLPRFVGDWIAVGPVLLFFASFPPVLRRVSEFLGRTSMGVFLVHPLLTVGLATLVKRTCAAPYGVVETLFVWVGAWMCSLVFAASVLRVEKLKWLVR